MTSQAGAAARTRGSASRPPSLCRLRRCMRSTRAYLAWVRDEVLLVALLGAALTLFLNRPELRDPHALPSLRLFLDTTVVLVAVIVSVLAYVRFSLERRWF